MLLDTAREHERFRIYCKDLKSNMLAQDPGLEVVRNPHLLSNSA